MKERPLGAPRHLPGSHTDTISRAPNAALMIDFDNVTMGIRSDLQKQLRALLNSEIIKGKVAVQRAYADWRRYPQYIVPLSEASIDLIFAPAFGSNKKNATDIRLAIDCLELVFTRPEIGTFILLSGDSDFSSLVLKLKEYGKYVIGVGLRESSSDLLIQNCDEYYSYTELTGLTKEGEFEIPRRDPWELVVEAVTQMKRDDDVMRSDRLKQVMQTIDPNFDERDAGFSRFSKFVQEAAQRGLLQLSRLENGQFGVDVGPNANVPPGEEAQLTTERRATKSAARRPPAPEPKQLTLAEGFELLRQALLVLGAVADDAAHADAVRDKMVELFGDESDPVFERGRFQRLLRQAHDAELIELVKDERGYQLKLRPQAVVVEEDEPTAAAAADQASREGEDGETRAKRTRTRGSRRGGRGRSRSKETPSEETPEPASTSTNAAAAAGPTPSRAEPKRNPRFRKGSRSAPPGPPKAALAPEPPPPAWAPRSATQQPSAAGRRTLGPRLGGRTAQQGADPQRPTVQPPGKVAPTQSPLPAIAPSAATPASAPEPGRAPPAERPAAGVAAPGGEDQGEGGGLFRRVSAALQRVVRATASHSDRGPEE